MESEEFNRPSREEIYMGVAYLFAQRSTCRRLTVGAVAVLDKRIIATGYNGSISTQMDGGCKCDTSIICQEAIHAEANLISFAAKHGIKLEGCTVYITHSPCVTCQRLLMQAGILEIVYSQEYRVMDFTTLRDKVTIRKYEGRTIQNNIFGSRVRPTDSKL